MKTESTVHKMKRAAIKITLKALAASSFSLAIIISISRTGLNSMVILRVECTYIDQFEGGHRSSRL